MPTYYKRIFTFLFIISTGLLTFSVYGLDCNACSYNCSSKCKKCVLGVCAVEPICLADCENKKLQCNTTAQILSTHFDAVNTKCANATGGTDQPDKIKRAKEILLERDVFYKILNKDQIDAVKFRWCNLNNIAGVKIDSGAITVSKDKVYIDDDLKSYTAEQLAPVIAHELYHVSQFHTYDYGGFKCRYGAELIAGHGFGRGNSMEEPAYELEDKVKNHTIGGHYCLDVHAPDMKVNGAKVQIWSCTPDVPQQKWKLESKSIKNAGGLCLDAHVADMNKNGGKIQVWACNGAPQQQWTYVDGQLVNGGGLCLDIASTKNDDGVKVQLWQCNSLESQRWNVLNERITSRK